MGLPGAKISDIRTVYSHPQALMQCSDFFDEHKDINQVAVRNTAFSAKKVKDDGDITQAGIASHISADIYGLQVLESRIQNNKNNATRFIIVSAKRVCRRDADRIVRYLIRRGSTGSLLILKDVLQIQRCRMR